MADVPSAELLARYREDDAGAAELLFHRYADRLIRLAQSRLSRKLAARVDAEDVVQSAYRSFFVLAREGGVTLTQSGDLWRLLVRITLRKVCRNVRRHRADCRSVEREEDWDAVAEANILQREPTPAEAAALVDELRHALMPLTSVQRRIVELSLQGHDVDEVAAQVSRSPRTVRRVLAAFGASLQTTPIPHETPALTEVNYADLILHQQLGQGGMGKVYRASLRGHDAPVAVKLLRKSLRQQDAAAARFLREAEVLARLRHPGIVAIHALGRLPDGGHFLVMDLVEGPDLGRRLHAGPIPLVQALTWVREAAEAIHHAHECGVVHCDLKPSNLLLDHGGRVRISDFGLARSLAEEGRRGTGGTPGFIASEQIDPALAPITARTDVYGLGAVLLALLGGRPPVFDSSECGQSEWVIAEPIIPADVPAEVATVCRRCLTPMPDGRFASAAEVAEHLRILEMLYVS